MKLERLSLVAVFALAACASDPNKRVEASETNLTSEQQKAREDQAELDRKQAEERTRNSNGGFDKHNEMKKTHEQEQAELAAEKKQDLSAAHRDVDDAHANLDQARRDFDAKVQERLDKAEAKAKELKTKSTKLDAKKKGEFESNYKLYTQARTDVTGKLKSIKAAKDDQFSSMKSDIEKRLDTMESALDKAASPF